MVRAALAMISASSALAERQPGSPYRGPRRLYADRGYDYDKYSRLLRKRGIKPLIARRGVAHGSGLGTARRGTVSRARTARNEGGIMGP